MMQPVILGLLAAFVGFSSSFAVVLQGFAAMGATPEQAASALFALCLGISVLGTACSLIWRMPIAIAWSTPGAALLAGSVAPAGGFPAAVGAFLFASALIVAAGFVKPLLRLVQAIPSPIANAMLAGVLLDLCLAPARAVGAIPALALPVVLVWLVMLRVARIWAVPAAVALAATLIAVFAPLPPHAFDRAGLHIAFVAPVFDLSTMIGVGLPLFLVTMASQNVPGIAVLQANGYRAPAAPVFVATGVVSGLGAFLGGHLVNFAAITAALCAGPESHPDPARRWVAGLVCGLSYVALAFGAGHAVAAVTAAPPVLIQGVAGLALLGALLSALQGSMLSEQGRLPAVLTFVTCASGLSFFGIGAAFWGLATGLVASRILKN
jgi:benzoate membrane transport protein